MTDGQLLKTMARLQRLTNEISYIIDEEILNHPNGKSLRGELHDNGLGYNWDFWLIAHSHLIHPGRWRYERKTRRLVYQKPAGAHIQRRTKSEENQA